MPTLKVAPTRRPALVVGDLSIFPPVLQAPMSAITNLAMRTLAEEQGCGFTITEWLPASALAAGVKSTLNKLRPSQQGRAFGVQIFGRNPDQMMKAAAFAASRGAALVDINMGCPGKKVRSGSCGAALMREPELAQDIVRATREGVAGECAVTVKMRAGWDDDSRNAPTFAPLMVEAGAQMITVHGRTRQQRYTGVVDLSIIAAVRRNLPNTPLVANGDVCDLPSMLRTFSETDADAVMIGRSAMGNPWIFAELASWWTENPAAVTPTRKERLAMYARHLDLYIAHSEGNPRRAVIEMRKFAPHYLKHLQDGAELRHTINRTESVDELKRLLRAAA